MSHVKRCEVARTNFPVVIIISRTESKAKVHVSARAHGRRAQLNLDSSLGQEIKAESFGSSGECAAVATE
jgi:hypothetical protein